MFIQPVAKFLCRADRITLTHPLAHYTGEIKDVEDYKQKIQKQKQLKNRTIKACKEFLNIEDLEILEYEMDKTEKVQIPPPNIPKLNTKKKNRKNIILQSNHYLRQVENDMNT